MNRFLSLFLLAILLTASCKTRSAQVESAIKTIDVAGAIGKGQIVPLSQIAESIEYIPLETNQNNMIDMIRYGYLVYENDKFYVKHKYLTYVFDKSGKFLFTFNKEGRGPQEYYLLSGISVDEDENIIVTSFDKFIMYDKSENSLKLWQIKISCLELF
ncbi:hypothetical protein MASR2M69_13290 [Bacteroidota bacterium]